MRQIIVFHCVAHAPGDGHGYEHGGDSNGKKFASGCQADRGARDGIEEERRKKNVENQFFGLVPEFPGIVELLKKKEPEQDDEKVGKNQKDAFHMADRCVSLDACGAAAGRSVCAMPVRARFWESDPTPAAEAFGENNIC